MIKELLARQKLKLFFSLYVLIMSALNAGAEVAGGIQNYPSLIISLLGIVACVLVFRRSGSALRLLNIWAVSQLVIIIADGKPFWSVEQVLSLNSYFEFTLVSGTVIKLGLNLLAILLIYCMWKLGQLNLDVQDKEEALT